MPTQHAATTVGTCGGRRARRRFRKEHTEEHFHLDGGLHGKAHASPIFWSMRCCGNSPEHARSRLNSPRSGVSVHGFARKSIQTTWRAEMKLARTLLARLGPEEVFSEISEASPKLEISSNSESRRARTRPLSRKHGWPCWGGIVSLGSRSKHRSV